MSPTNVPKQPGCHLVIKLIHVFVWHHIVTGLHSGHWRHHRSQARASGLGAGIAGHGSEGMGMGVNTVSDQLGVVYCRGLDDWSVWEM